MRDELLNGIAKLCWMFPQLKPSIRFSEAFSGEEIDVFYSFANRNVRGIVSDKQKPALFECSQGLSRIRQQDVVFVESLLSAASGKDLGLSPEMRDLTGLLREHVHVWWSLHDAYVKIVRDNLVGTFPLAPVRKSLFGGNSEFHKAFHLSIHALLEDAGICFGDDETDEGFVAYLHGQVMGKKACASHYSGADGRRYLKRAAAFEQSLNSYPRSSVISVLQRLRDSKAL